MKARAVLLVAAAALIAGCQPSGHDGSASQATSAAPHEDLEVQDAATILETGRQTLDGLSSVHMTADSETYSLSLWVSDETRCHGTVASREGRMQFVSDGQTYWLNANEAFWEASGQPAAGAAAADTWARMTYQTAVAADISHACTVKEVAAFLSWNLGGVSMETEGTDVVDGTTVVVVGGTINDVATQAFVAQEDPRIIVRIDRDAPDGASTMTFTEPDGDVVIEPPANAIDVEDLMQAP
jgi:hypothetical protein